MKQIPAIIERASDGTYSVYCEHEIFSGMGDTAEAAKKDMEEQMKFYKQTAKEERFKYPEFLDGEFEVVYRWDCESLLALYSDILTLTGLGKRSGINHKQLWSYMHGNSKPRRAQLDKLENAIHELGRERLDIKL